MNEAGDDERSLIVGTASGAGGTTGAPGPRENTLATGRTIVGSTGTRYELGRKLGQGGMADVFLARKIASTGFSKDVALKCVTADIEPDEAIRRMFLYEARLASHFRHQGIAEAYDLEEIGGRYYLVLEYIDGPSLREVMRRAAERKVAVPVEFACYVAACIAEALRYAHSVTGADGQPLGVVHRDVSAKNVMVTKAGVPKLLDFGIAYARMQGRDRTGTGRLRGTYVYMSPEQTAGQKLDARSDLFSLGILLVEMLTGRRVFEQVDDYLTGKAIEECSPVKVTEATRELPVPLQKICRRALSKDPASRFQTGDEFAQALRSVLVELDPLYGPRECAADLVEVGALAGSTADTPSRDSSLRRRRGARRRVGWFIAGALGVGMAAGAAATWLLPRSMPATTAAAPSEGPLPHGVSPAPGGTGEVARPSAAVPDGSASLVPSRAVVPDTAAPEPSPPVAGPVEPAALPGGAPIVRKRRPTKREKASAAPIAEGSPAPAPPRAKHSALVGFADRGMVANATETLARGTLLRVKLSAQLDAMRGGAVQAVVTEDVYSGATVLAPRGSVVKCRAGGAVSGRVSLSCDSMQAGERRWTFNAIGLGEGDRAGLEVAEGSIPAGTPFTVFVTASAVLD